MVVLGGIVLSILLGGGIGYCGRSRPSPGPGNLTIPVVPGEGRAESRTRLEARLEQLISDAREGRVPQKLAGFNSLVLTWQMDPVASAWIPERLDEADVPIELLVAFLRRVRSRPVGETVLRERVIHRLGSDRLQERETGVELVRRLRIGHSIAVAHCGCTAGIYPAQPQAGEPCFLFAYGLGADSGIEWEPRPLTDSETGWNLDLKTGSEGKGRTSLVTMKRAPPGRWTVLGNADGSARIRIESLD